MSATRRLPADDTLVIHFAHVAYRLAERFALRGTGIAHFQTWSREDTLARIGEGHVLERAIRTGQAPSMVLWGPPGTGKTTLARLVAGLTKSHFIGVSAVTSGVADLRQAVEEAREIRATEDLGTILFVDEVHRFNKAQQDAILPHVENGTVTFIGATTENPSFEVISALLSRTRVLTLHPLSDDEIAQVVRHALADTERGLGNENVTLDPDALAFLQEVASGDARVALNGIELATEIAQSAPLAVQSIRATLRRGLAEAVREATDHELAEQSRLRRTDDHREGVAATAERRLADFRGR